MYTEEKKRNTNYGSIFIYCFFSFAFVVEVVRLAKPYYNVQNLMKTEALVVEEGFLNKMEKNLRAVPSHSGSGAAHGQKLSIINLEEGRRVSPISYGVKVQSFSTFSELVQQNFENKYESRPFSAGGYNWTFIIYPNYDKPLRSGAYTSVYIRIDNSTFIDNPKDVYAWFRFLAYRRDIDSYFQSYETKVQRLNSLNRQHGIVQFVQLALYRTPEYRQYGYVYDGDHSVFGVDIFVVNKSCDWEELSYDKNISDRFFNWKLTKFSTHDLDSYTTSATFSSGGRNWVLKVYPNGVSSAKGNSLSFYILSASNEKGYVQAKLRVINQKGSKHFEKQVKGWPNPTESGWGFDKFISLSDLKDTSKGFLVDDIIKFEVEFVSITKTEIHNGREIYNGVLK